MKILDHSISFPHPTTAHSSGVLAIGGDLSVPRLMLAYRYGIFPWYNKGEPILWWHPDPRFVLYPADVKVSKSMRSIFNQEKYRVTFDTAFEEVVTACGSSKERKKEGTWISEDIADAYIDLYDLGLAHSIEVWDGEELIGGLYGVASGKIFSGESMFSKGKSASKVALIILCRILEQQNFTLIDCQIENPHLKSMGGVEIPRIDFMKYINNNSQVATDNSSWATFGEGLELKNML